MSYNLLWVLWIIWLYFIIHYGIGEDNVARILKNLIFIRPLVFLVAIYSITLSIRNGIYMFKHKKKMDVSDFNNMSLNTQVPPTDPGVLVMGDDVEITIKAQEKKSITEHPTAVIPETCVIKGELNCSSDIHINGRIDGVIRSEKSVKILNNGHIEGDIYADTIEIDGTLEGNCIGREVSINATGMVNGKIQSDSLSINKKGRFFGTSQPREDVNNEMKIFDK